MPADIRHTIQALADSFASNIVHAIRGLSLDDLAQLDDAPHRAPRRARKSAAPARHKKRARRSDAELKKVAVTVAGVVHGAGKKGINAETIRAALRLPRPVVQRAIQDALEAKTIRKRGQKRSTMYFRA